MVENRRALDRGLRSLPENSFIEAPVTTRPDECQREAPAEGAVVGLLSFLRQEMKGNLKANFIYSLTVTRVLMEFAMKHCSCAS